MYKQRSTAMPTHSGSHAVWVLAHESQEELAKAVVKCCEQWQQKAKEQWKEEWNSNGTREIQYKSVLEWKKFADGFPNLFIRDVKDMAGKDVIFIASFHSVDVIFEQISMIYQIPRYLAHSCTVILPYFPTGTMERIDLEGQVATAKTLATILSEIPSTARGPVQIMIFDIHALQERFYFSRSVIPRLESAIPLLLNELQTKFQNREVAIAFPDDGAEKRFSGIFPQEFNRIICHKFRDGDKRVVKIKEGDPTGKEVVIVDDLVQTGGTLIEAGKVLISGRAASVSAFVTHPVFPNESWRKFTDTNQIFTNFWITDSIPHAKEICTHKPFQLLSLAGIIADSLLGFDLRQWGD